MNEDLAISAVAAVAMLVFVGSALIARRPPLKDTAKMALAWVAIIGVAFVLFSFRGEFSNIGARLKSELMGTPMVEGGTVRIPMQDDGHFWTVAEVNGRNVRFMIDSGATFTVIARANAEAAGVESSGRKTIVGTANGNILLTNGRAARFAVGSIEREDMSLWISDNDDTNVIGMNFLSSLDGWRVEGRDLVLNP